MMNEELILSRKNLKKYIKFTNKTDDIYKFWQHKDEKKYNIFFQKINLKVFLRTKTKLGLLKFK